MAIYPPSPSTPSHLTAVSIGFPVDFWASSRETLMRAGYSVMNSVLSCQVSSSDGTMEKGKQLYKTCKELTTSTLSTVSPSCIQFRGWWTAVGASFSERSVESTHLSFKIHILIDGQSAQALQFDFRRKDLHISSAEFSWQWALND